MFTLESFVQNEHMPLTNGVSGAGQYTTNIRDLTGDAHFDPGLSRPYRDERGRVWVDVTVGHEQVKGTDGFPVFNSRGEPKYKAIYDPQLVQDRRLKDYPVINVTSNANVLRKDQWALIDAKVQTASRKRLRLWADMRASNTFGGFDGMATPVLAFERMTDAGQAIMDMDGMTEGRNFAPKFALDGMNLPITHADFFLSSRFLATSRARGGQGADTIRSEMASRRVAEQIERTALGLDDLSSQFSADLAAIGGTSGQTGGLYGLLNHPDRLTKNDMTAPTGANGTVILTEWLEVLDLFFDYNFEGPWMVYHSSGYAKHLDNLFSTTEPSAGSLRNRLMQIEGIQGIRRLPYLTEALHPNTLIFVQMGDEVQAVNGMEITTVQWETMGGMKLNFKVMGIQVPRITSVNVNSGITQPVYSQTAKAPILVATTS